MNHVAYLTKPPLSVDGIGNGIDLPQVLRRQELANPPLSIEDIDTPTATLFARRAGLLGEPRPVRLVGGKGGF